MLMTTEPPAALQPPGAAALSPTAPQQVAKHPSRDPDSPKLFVGQIPPQCKEQDLLELFAPFGRIHDLVIFNDHGARTKGYGFVSFVSRMEADLAVCGLNERKMLPGGRYHIQVRYADGELDRLEPKLFVGRLPRNTQVQDLNALFEPFGPIKETKILTGLSDGACRGCAFMRMPNRDSALRAIAELNEKASVHDQQIVVSFAEVKANPRRKRLQEPLHAAPPMFGIADPYAMAAGAPVMVPVGGGGGGGGQPPYYVPSVKFVVPNGGGGDPTAPTGARIGAAAGPPHPPDLAAAAHLQIAAAAAAQPYYYPHYGLWGPQAAIGYPLGAGAGLYYAPAAGNVAAPPLEGPPDANLFVMHIPKDWRNSELYTVFQPYGPILSANVYLDKATNESRCFGFVSYDNSQSARAAIAALNGFQVGGKRLKVETKRAKQGTAMGRKKTVM